MSMSYIILIIIVLKLFRISNGKSKRIKFPNLWLFPVLFILMIIEDYVKTLNFSIEEILLITIFTLVGVGVGIIRGRTLKYHRDKTTGEIYYSESYLSLGVYVFLILIKWFLRYVGGHATNLIGIWLLVFACASMVGRSIWLSYQYLYNSRASE